MFQHPATDDSAIDPLLAASLERSGLAPLQLRGRRLRMIGVASVAVILMAGLLVFGF